MGTIFVPDPLATDGAWSGRWVSGEITIEIFVHSPDVLNVSISDKGLVGGAVGHRAFQLNVPPLNVNGELIDVNKFKVPSFVEKSVIVLNTIQAASGEVTLTLVKSPDQQGSGADQIQYHRHLEGPFFVTHVIPRLIS
ncbi:MAG TPA: hypothetical protein VGD60_20375 [Candidatus Acidoferrales bacterium]